MAATDPDRATTYLCEDRLSRWAQAGTAVLVEGRWVAVEAEHTFTTLASARLFCTLTCVELGLPPVGVRLRQGEAQSHYHPGRGEIALASWGARRLVIVHELAHHLAQHDPRRTPDEPAHGPLFRASMLRLLRHLGLARQADELESLYRHHGLSPAPPLRTP